MMQEQQADANHGVSGNNPLVTAANPLLNAITPDPSFGIAR